MASAPRSACSPARRSPSTGFGREPIFTDERAAREFAGSSPARRVGARLRYFESVDSTNARARRLAELGWPEGTVVLAEHQTDGRGRLGRSWVCPPRAGLLVSVILAAEGRALRPSSGDADWGGPAPAWLTAAGALGMIEAVEHSGAAGLLVEWPNDIVAPDEGGGVLVEARGASQAMILGVGLNVDVRAEEFPPELRACSGSVLTVSGRDPDRRAIFGRCLAALESRIERPRRLAEERRERSFTLGREVELPSREPGGPPRRACAVGF
ncbi:MAG: biotin--[acetyl-CoA-carboxylase] ligase, partial [Planctomycetota bacterium]